MRRTDWPSLGAVALVLVALAAEPTVAVELAEVDATPSVDELVAEAVARNPSLASLEQRLAAARERVAPAGALPDPMVGLMLTDVGFPSWTVGDEMMSMVGPEVSQRLPYPGKRGARRDAAAARVEVVDAELDRVRRQVVAEVRRLYAGLYAADQERRALDEGEELLELLSETAVARYTVGQTEQEAVLKAQLKLSRLLERRTDLEARRTALVSGLERLLDRDPGQPVGQVLVLPEVSTPPDSWSALAQERSPEVALARREVETAAREAEVARLELRPDFLAGAAVGARGGMDPAVTLRFGVELPLWHKGKQTPLLRAAEHEVAAAEEELRRALADARSTADRLTAEWSRAQAQVLRYREAIVPQTSATVDAARAAYLAGRGDFSTVVEDFDQWLDARIGLSSREAERFAVWAEVEALVGEGMGSGSGSGSGSE